jgi:hypothetical protein
MGSFVMGVSFVEMGSTESVVDCVVVRVGMSKSVTTVGIVEEYDV